MLKNDFVLAIQTSLQVDVLKNCGPNKIICIDATHGTNAYDFSLITVVVVDEFGEGYPTAWCLSNRTDLEVVIQFFVSIKKKTGNIKWVMTDDASQYFNAWVNVFGEGPHKLLCSWHVDRAWRGHLKSITDKMLTQTLYHNLRALMDETDETKFEDMLQKTIEQMLNSDSSREFGEYFETYYSKRKAQWASCYRKSSGINTNMYVESFHKVLKYIYFKGKTNRRVDKCIQVLLKYDRDKAFDRLIKLEKGKQTGRIRVINKRHQLSKKLTLSQVSDLNHSSWKVASSNSKEEYIVTHQTSVCPSKCLLKCVSCNICIHMYYCNCMDATVIHTICKHIHLVVRYNLQLDCKHSENQEINDSTVSKENSPSLKQSLLQTLTKCRQDSLYEVKQRLLNKLSILTTQVSMCKDTHALLTVEKCISTATSACKLVSPCKFNTPTKQVPPNKNITPQRPFLSTKKKAESRQLS